MTSNASLALYTSNEIRVIEQARAGSVRLPERVAQRTKKKPRLKAFSL